MIVSILKPFLLDTRNVYLENEITTMFMSKFRIHINSHVFKYAGNVCKLQKINTTTSIMIIISVKINLDS